ncbi:tetratricopeptide repeat protein [Micromonospora marina]|uniref:tetratricopeptide repeat protein n=1 Tax=Micromonospora marina TaxID=307120 RepID=UPI000B88DE80
MAAAVLAAAYADVGDTARAITLLAAVLIDAKRILGHDHPDTLVTATHLAALYLRDGFAEKAFAIFDETLAGCERTLGLDHPDTLAIREALPILRQQYRPRQA